ncbi:ABC transporter ATP-binding protein [Bradyrhizobium sp. NP1]|uniref:ABC transporter ATP-binding protein n=1 Tax=Bradyrhizobium sp. NP1 TaxID=3049772 RepID=UPI0025A61F8C|nr:ABC transporter ATP-binding protein [Bradyrhizobium sp. NP1]WJR79891.1 ABC transporter ATP-binding protein [Bradyrhizobium sp. NP1]
MTQAALKLPPTSDARRLLAVEGVSLQYRTQQHVVTATHRVSFSVEEGERYVILGPSGCGKSTLLKAVGGFMTPISGRIVMRDRLIQAPGPDRMMVFQEFEQLMPWKTVMQNVVFPMKVTGKFGRREAQERASAMLERVKLGKFRDVYPHMLSGGMKMRVALARAMALEPEILLMDEPFAALDALTRREMQAELLQLWEQSRFTMLFVTHSIDEAIIVGSRILVLSPHPGQVRAELDASAFGAEDVGSEPFGALSRRIHELLFGQRATRAGGVLPG